ncbi:hypothetical protein HRG_009330 [Hirsutella rhossiliensis]|uniref:Uncharacterized protein n=1 Tax=Hirsutella rhossiliensis TaxID=111463 RepID=A0A9P8MNP6_9HYPO|nr:uncharacterized protein HRG_09330 [Hirsutella rhossiliensis]KAH0959548.1 hypothetical protein HRG_09330 [Hirsutella rhossiliensis]
MQRSDYILYVRPRDDHLNDALCLLAKFDDTPAPVTYSLVNGDGIAERSLDEVVLLLAHVLSLIFGRQIEHAAFTYLHKHLPKPRDISTETIGHFVEQLFALRWRIGLDSRRRIGLYLLGRQREASVLLSRIERDRSLCKKLYFCLYHARQNPRWRRPGVDEAAFGDRLHWYAGTRQAVSETLYQVDSLKAFADWMRRGEELIEEAGLQEQDACNF